MYTLASIFLLEVLWRRNGIDLLGITLSINGRKRDTSIHDIEVGLVSQIDLASDIVRNRLWEADNLIAVDCASTVES